MSKLFKLARFAALAAVCLGALSSSASATTWTSNGVLAFAAIGSAGGRIVITGASGGSVMNCSAASIIGTLNASASFPANAGNLTLRFNTCSVAAQTYTLSCTGDYGGSSPASFSALGHAAGVTQIAASGISCLIRLGPTTCTTISGSMRGEYTNPVLVIPTSGVFRFFSTNQSFAMTTSACAGIVTGTPRIGAPGAGTTGLADLLLTVSSPAAPGSQPQITGV
jgi:hypothetical protein